MDTFFCGWSTFEPEDIGWSQAVLEGSKAVSQKSKKAMSTARKQIKQFCALNKQFNTPLDATLAKRFVDFEVAQGDGPMCAQNLWDT